MNVFLSRGKEVISISEAAQILECTIHRIRKAISRHKNQLKDHCWILEAEELKELKAAGVPINKKVTNLRVLTSAALAILTKMVTPAIKDTSLSFVSQGKEVVSIGLAAERLHCTTGAIRMAVCRHKDRFKNETWLALDIPVTDCDTHVQRNGGVRVFTYAGMLVLADLITTDNAAAVRDSLSFDYADRREYKAPAALPAPATPPAAPSLPEAFDNSPALKLITERMDGMQRQLNMLANACGTAFPAGYLPFRSLSKKSGLTESVCHRLVAAWHVPTAHGQTVSPVGIVVPTQCAEAVGFQAALYEMMGQATRHGDSNRWSHPEIGNRFQALGWPREPKF